MVRWEYFNKFSTLEDKYLPSCGEGENMAEQIVTAVCKIIYKWYNDGDVYDNTGRMYSWCNDISSYANWLRENTDAKAILDRIFDCAGRDDYEELLKDLANKLIDEEYLGAMEQRRNIGSIYEATGPYKFEYSDDDEEDDYEDYDEEA